MDTAGTAPSMSADRVASSERLVSVVVPMHEAARWIGQALTSILAQSYEQLEVLVLDDASRDGGAEVVASVDDPRVSLHRHERNVGQFANVNAGIRLARGDMIAVHHADDVYERDLIAAQVAYLDAEPTVGAVFALDTFIDPSGRPFGRLELPSELRGERPLTYPEVLNAVLRYGNTFLRASSSLVRRDVYESVGLFSQAYGLRGDLEMWLRIARAYPVAIIERHLVRYRWGHENVSQGYERLRTQPELTFSLLDERLAAGDVALARPEALRSFEGRRAEDALIVTANLYTLDRRADGQAMLREARLRRLLGTRQVRRARLLVLWVALHALLRLPRIRLVADSFYRRWGRGRGL